MAIKENEESEALNHTEILNDEVETKYPLAVTINKNQNDFIVTLKENYFAKLGKKRLSADRKRRVSKEIDNLTKIDVKSLYALAEDAIKNNKDVTHEELTEMLKNSVSEPKAMLKRKKVYKVFGKGKVEALHIISGIKTLVVKFYENNQNQIDGFVVLLIGRIVNDVLKKTKIK